MAMEQLGKQLDAALSDLETKKKTFESIQKKITDASNEYENAKIAITNLRKLINDELNKVVPEPDARIRAA